MDCVYSSQRQILFEGAKKLRLLVIVIYNVLTLHFFFAKLTGITADVPHNTLKYKDIL